MSKRKQPLSQAVYRQILQRMTARRIKPGQIITRRGMADTLGVSMAPVAEAFAELERDGLLETMPRQGTRVRSFALEDAREQAVVRLALETQAARMVCGPVIVSHRETLARVARKLDGRGWRGVRRWRLDIDFHRHVAALTGQRLLVESLDRVLRLGFFIAVQTAVGLDDGRRPSSRHGWLLGQLEKNDPELAEQAMRRHLLDGSIGRVMGEMNV